MADGRQLVMEKLAFDGLSTGTELEVSAKQSGALRRN